MKNLRNSVLLIGHLGQDPDIRKLQNGKIMARLNLATNETYKKSNGDKVTTTQWHRCIAWGRTAEIMESFLKKGKEVAVRGKLTYNSYEDKNGIMRSSTQILISEFVMLR